MLPEKLKLDEQWSASGLRYKDSCKEVLDTELLHLCWLVEDSIWDTPKMEDYIMHLSTQVHPVYQNNHLVHATWQQRTVALAKVKGIEICQ